MTYEGEDLNTDTIKPNKHAATTKYQRTEKLWLSCVFACSYAFETTLNTAGRTRLVTPTRPTSRNSVFNQNTRTTFKVTTSENTCVRDQRQREREKHNKTETECLVYSILFYCILNQHK